MFERDKNYFVSYKNINHACFRMLDELVPNQYKVSYTPALIGWNATMSIQFILNQLEDVYNKPLAAALFANDTLFKSPFAATKAPKLLFYHMEQCQEIMTLGKLTYTPEQVIANALHLLMASQIFPNQEFKTWETMAVKTYPALKTFIHEAYSHQLNAMELQNMTSTLGYGPLAQNKYHMLDMGDDDNSAMDITVTTQVAAAAMGTMAASLLGQGTAAASAHPGLLASINQSIAPAFNQVVQNQLVLQSQITAILFAQPPPVQAPTAFMVPPVPQVAFPMQQPFQPPV
jgi:hypothetical protein